MKTYIASRNKMRLPSCDLISTNDSLPVSNVRVLCVWTSYGKLGIDYIDIAWINESGDWMSDCGRIILIIPEFWCSLAYVDEFGIIKWSKE